jgi:Fe-S-cluster containining protein
MPERYFQYQSGLAASERHMRCPEDCDAPGCWMAEVVVGATLFDLIGLSLALNMPVSSLFLNYCRFGFQSNEFNPRYLRVLVKLNKPCPFFQKARCTVHRYKPLNCVLFPEYHQIAGLLPELVNRPVFKKFPCLKSKIHVSNTRSRTLKKLKKMQSREDALSCYFLFGTPSFIIDARSLTKQLKKSGLKNQSFSQRFFYRKLYETLKLTGCFDGILDKVTRLDSRQEMERLFSQLENQTFVKSLLGKRRRPEILFRIDGNRLKPVKRYL